ncbi:hypothetical protein [Nonomuraea typhae]|nr:hypothetical protein [Nonomuraea typhae]
MTTESRQATSIDVEVKVEGPPLPTGLKPLLELAEPTIACPADEP